VREAGLGSAEPKAGTVEEIRAIDPDTGEPSTLTDQGRPQPSGAQAGEGQGDESVSAPPRGIASRTISDPIVQPLDEQVPGESADESDPFVIKSVLPIEGTIRYGEWFWDETDAPETGALVITVDLEARVISAFRDGHEIGTAVALLGTRKHPTPLGVFPILTKEKDNISEKYNDAPMPWTLRLTWDGIAIHGSPVLNGYASHGCIGVPDPFAERLFAAADRGDKVVITRGRYIGKGDRLIAS
jgi:lipoprotein-anchoring transpeptidase ErfK/SrfK